MCRCWTHTLLPSHTTMVPFQDEAPAMLNVTVLYNESEGECNEGRIK